jgi:cysteine-rich repeat protein
MLGLPRSSACWLVAVLVACGDDESGTGDDTSSTDPSSSTDTTADDTGSTGETTASSTTPADESSGTGFDPPEPMCGNGYVEPGEECDDANDVEDDECSSACLRSCGLAWSVVHLGPTQESDIYGLRAAVDGDDRPVALGFQRQVDVDPKGKQTIGEPTALVIAYEADGTERWTQLLAQRGLSVSPGDVAVDPSGTAYVATRVELEDGSRDTHVTALSADDGSTLWTHELAGPVVDGDDEPNAITMTPDGDLVLVATVRVADMNDDVWVRKIAADDGSEVWTATYDGMAEGQFSTDNGGPVAVGADGTIYVLAQPYVDLSTLNTTLLAFGPDGGEPLWSFTPTQDGAVQEFSPVEVSVGDDGGVYFGYARYTSQVEFWVAKLDATGAPVWELDRDDFIMPGVGEDWRLYGVMFAPERGPIAIGSYITGRSMDAWAEAWVSQLDPEGELRCATTHEAESGGFMHSTLYINGGAVGVDGGPVLVGELIDEPESGVWLGRFRPQ